MSKKVILELTELEARAMSFALTEATNHGDIMDQMFPDSSERQAAHRAERKLLEARIKLLPQHGP